jgi:FkbM family methyltransferase
MSQDGAERLVEALAAIGRDEELRVRFVALLRQAEVRLARPGFDVRETVTGPIVDALHECLGRMRKRLASGVDFHFHYRSRIARELVLAPDAQPDPVREPQSTRLLLQLARTAKHVLIGGAKGGDQAIPVASAIRGFGGVQCFAPDPEQMSMLRVNAAANGLDNLRFNHIGLWGRDKALLRPVRQGGVTRLEPVAQKTDASFAATTIAAYGSSQRLDHIELIKLNIAGAELTSLNSAERFLAQSKEKAPNLVFRVHRDHTDWSRGLDNTEICQYLSGFGYHLFAVRDYELNVPMNRHAIELIRPEETYLEGPPHGFNMLAVKEVAILANPMFRFVSGVSPLLLKHRDPRMHQPLAGAA